MENKISIQVPAETLTSLLTKAGEISTALDPFIQALTPVERQLLPKIGQVTLPFVESAKAYFQTNPEFAPPYISTAELNKDYNAWKDLRQVHHAIEQIYRNLDDTIMLLGSETYIACLSYYNSVKQAAKINVPNAKPILEDLQQRFKVSSVVEEPVPVPNP